LPDGFFSNQKFQFRYILEDLGMENVVIYSGHLEYCMTIGYILWHLVILQSFGAFFPSFETLSKLNLATLLPSPCIDLVFMAVVDAVLAKVWLFHRLPHCQVTNC
jgi:hypothetical protein